MNALGKNVEMSSNVELETFRLRYNRVFFFLHLRINFSLEANIVMMIHCAIGYTVYNQRNLLVCFVHFSVLLV